MKPLFVTLALSSAFLHAGWNTFVKVATVRLIAIATISLGFSVVGALMIPIYGIPNQRAWGYLVLLTCFYYEYLWPLNEAYRIDDLSHTYPLFQGSAPLFVAIGAALFGRDWLSPLGFLGVLVASLGIMSLGVFGKMKTRHTTRGLYVPTLATSLVIATMMASNALGARASGSSRAFVAWILFLQAPVVAVCCDIARGTVL